MRLRRDQEQLEAVDCWRRKREQECFQALDGVQVLNVCYVTILYYLISLSYSS